MKKTLTIFISFIMIFATLMGGSDEVFAKEMGGNVTVNPSTYTVSWDKNYNLKENIPKVTIKNSKKVTMKEGKDYVLYRPNNRDTRLPGKFTIRIYYQGNYYGYSTVNYYVKPKKNEISSVSANSKGFTVKWKINRPSPISGYQIQFSTSSKFNGAKTVTVSNSSAASKTITGRMANKKYYVRMRTYYNYYNYTVGKNGNKDLVENKGKIYSSWSKTKTVTTKK